MDLEKFKVLVQVLETKNLSVTASNLGYSTSGISRIITSLEKELGFKLLKRTRDGVSPTIQCTNMLPYFKNFIEAGELCLEKARSEKQLPKKISIGVAHVSLYTWLGEVAFRTREAGIKIDIELIYGSSSDLAKMVEEHKIDFAIITKRNGNFGWIHMWDDEEVVWVPKNHKLASLESISLDVFQSESCILPMTDVETDYSILFKENGLKPNLLIATKDDYAAFSIVSSGTGISINSRISSFSDDERVKIIPLNPRVKLDIGIAISKDIDSSVYIIIDQLIEKRDQFEGSC